jgi:phosphatidylserine/phosphatidylglycerophosphate/cardiolipin synthase-like enzyme
VYGEILSEIKKSKEKIEIFTYSFTDPFFIYELENASFKEKNIFILSDEWNLIYNSPLKNTVSLNIKYIPGIHAKTIIIDEKVLIIGSYNFTYRAREVNDEFVLIIFNEELSQKISKKFKELWNNIL